MYVCVVGRVCISVKRERERERERERNHRSIGCPKNKSLKERAIDFMDA